MKLANAIVELYRKAAIELPKETEDALTAARDKEQGIGLNVMNTVLENIRLAKEKNIPMCQDTGTPLLYVHYPRKYSQEELRKDIVEATKKATADVPLRPNAVDSITGKNSGNNIGINCPIIHFEEHDGDLIIDLMLKGGGSENTGMVYSLPDIKLGAGRDLDGVRKCVIDAVFKAQGKACPPELVGVGIGGSMESVMGLAKRQLFRKLDDVNENKELADFEKGLYTDLNKMGIGPAGLGGKTTVIGVKAAAEHRHPASFFVAVAFFCWACRKKRLTVRNGDFIYD